MRKLTIRSFSTFAAIAIASLALVQLAFAHDDRPTAATVANDVVFTSDYAGTIYGFDTQTGKTLWTAKAPAGINAFPSIDGDTLLVGAGATGFFKKPQFQLIAYSLP